MNVSGNNNPSPTVREDALAIKTQMEVFATPRNGTVKIMANMSHLWEEIYNNGIVNENPRILIVWTGEIARGEYAGGDRTKLHRVDRQWNVVIMRGHGFKNSAPHRETEFAGSLRCHPSDGPAVAGPACRSAPFSRIGVRSQSLSLGTRGKRGARPFSCLGA